MYDVFFLVCCRLVIMGLLFCSMLLILNNLCVFKFYLIYGRIEVGYEYFIGIIVYK